jgi:hypothetical protein
MHDYLLSTDFLWLDEEGGYYRDAYIPAWEDRLKPSPDERIRARLGW